MIFRNLFGCEISVNRWPSGVLFQLLGASLNRSFPLHPALPKPPKPYLYPQCLAHRGLSVGVCGIKTWVCPEESSQNQPSLFHSWAAGGTPFSTNLRYFEESEILVFLDFPEFILWFVLWPHLTSWAKLVLITSPRDLKVIQKIHCPLNSKQNSCSPPILFPVHYFFFKKNSFLGLKFA